MSEVRAHYLMDRIHKTGLQGAEAPVRGGGGGHPRHAAGIPQGADPFLSGKRCQMQL